MKFMSRTWGGRGAASLFLLATLAPTAGACFGTKLRIEVPRDARGALVAYAAGYFIEEKTGVEPEFVEAVAKESAAAVDLRLVAADRPAGPGGVLRPAGAEMFWIRADVLDDLRFTTVDRAIQKLAAFYASPSFQQALRSSAPPKKASRKAVLDAK